MRLAILAAGEIYGGVERHVLGLASRLRDRSHAVVPILFHDRELAAQLGEAGFEPRIIGQGRALDRSAVPALSRILDSESIDLLHVHGYKSVVIGGRAIGRRTCGLVATMHGMNEPSAGNPIRWLKTRLYGQLENRTLRAQNAGIAYVTADIMGSYEQAHQGLERRVIHNGIDPMSREGLKKPSELSDDLFHVGLVGRISPVKAIDTAIQALQKADLPVNVVLDIVGDGPQREELEALAKATGRGERIRFHGHRSDIFDFLAHLDVLLMPSLHEGLPYTLLEALSLGIPVLASRVGGLAEVLESEKTALLFERGDLAGQISALERIVSDGELRARLSAAGQDLQKQSYSLVSMVESYLSLYSRLSPSKTA